MRKRKERFIALLTGMVLIMSSSISNWDSIVAQAAELSKKSVEMLFDFNITGSNTAKGWTGITVNKKDGNSESDYLYTSEKGYGIVPNESESVVQGRKEAVTANEDYQIPEDVYTDFALMNGREFAVDLENGIYSVQFIVGSTNTNTTTVMIEGKEEYKDSLKNTKGSYDVLSINDVEVTDGQMNIAFCGGSGGDRINGIVISSIMAPANVKASQDFTNMKIDLAWDMADGAASYNIYRVENGISKQIGNTKECHYSDFGVEMLGDYTYYVKAVGSTGMESAASEAIEVELRDEKITLPSTPQNAAITNITEELTTLSWEPVEGAVQYRIYWSDRNRTDLQGTDGYTLAGITTDTTYQYEKSTHMKRYFKVVAANLGGESQSSEVLEAPIKKTISSQVEYLDRGLVAVNTSEGVFVSWRIPEDEYVANASYELYRDGNKIATIGAEDNSNYLDKEGSSESTYTIKSVINGTTYQACDSVSVWSEQYLQVNLQKPEPYYDDKLTTEYEYTPNDTTVADADGDGEYELFVKWDGISKDNSKDGYTSPVYIDCYKLDGTLLWRIDLGINIRAGAHYTQLQVFDFDGDGKAEVICKTADGTLDANGTPIDGTDEVIDYRSVKGEKSSTGLVYEKDGYVLDGPEYLTLFDGETGIALDTIDYDPPRGDVSAWGDSYGNRVDRFLSGVAYLDGVHPSAIFARGYYTRAVACAYDVVNNKLVQRWKIDSNDEESKDFYGQGAHSITAADVDNDGCQEIMYGSATIDHDGTLLYSLSQKGKKHGGHGDAERVSDFNLKNPGLEIFMVHENYPWDAGIEMHDGNNSDYLFSFSTTDDIGRGATADIDPRYEGAESWAVIANKWNAREGKIVTQDGEEIGTTIPAANFTIWWDGDLGREILDHTFVDENGEQYPVSVNISKWDWENQKETVLLESDEVYSNNGTKGNPCFQADIFGDWREEAAWRTTDGNAIRIYTTVDLSDYRLYTLMHDTQYRAQVACESTGYNQPPSTSFYIGFDEDFINVPVPTLNIVNNQSGEVEKPVETNKAGLQVAVTIYENYAEEDYTSETWEVFSKALETANIVIANETATQEEIDAALNALLDAGKNLKKVQVIQEELLKVSYSTHVQNLGWQSYVFNGEMAGTKGKGLRLEGIRIRLDNNPFGGNIEYRTHVQNVGWQSYVSNGEMAGTKGKSLRLEALQIRLTGSIAQQYNIYYRTHVQDLGWLGWTTNDGKSGTAGLSKRLEGIEIRLVKKGEQAPGSTDNAYITNKK